MGNLMNWTVLFVAGLFEVVWAVGLKYTEGFTRLWPSIGTGAAFLLSIGLLSWAMRDLPVGTAYAVWVGIGAVGTARGSIQASYGMDIHNLNIPKNSTASSIPSMVFSGW